MTIQKILPLVSLLLLMIMIRLSPSRAFLRTSTAYCCSQQSRVQRTVYRSLLLQSSSSNIDLVQQRLEVARAKKQAREQSTLERVRRNLQIKQVLYNGNAPEDLYAVKVSVCNELRQELRLSAREKRGRVFCSPQSVTTLRSLQRELHSFFRALRKSTYVLKAGLPIISESSTEGSSNAVSAPTDEDGNIVTDSFWSIESDKDVVNMFQVAGTFFAGNANRLTRPSILLHVEKDPNAPPPPPPPAYLQNMPDPSQSDSMTMLSFYAFPPDGINDPEAFAMQLRRQWKPFQALGRVYVATEGVNAQMSVPTTVLANFMQCCRSIPELGVHMENGINIDPVTLSREEFAVAGTAVKGAPAPPFRNLYIRVRQKVVADGLDKTYDWQAAGYDMPPLEWHQRLKQAQKGEEKPILLDCRNTYETDIGKFVGAEPLNTESFRESWNVLKERLKDTPKDAPIMTYCTGGIRCVKVGAYLTQELGFTNVSRLAGGIIAYDRTVTEQASDEEKLFKGTNFVFDGRLGRPITEDALGICVTCGAETSIICNCRNENCHKRMTQCESCQTSYHGTCSDACRHRLLNGAMRPRRNFQPQAEQSDVVYNSIDDYSLGHSSPTPSIYPEMELNTKTMIPTGSHMVSGSAQGRLLTQFASMTREGRILELGTFTGYATACLVEGACNVAKLNAQGEKKGSRDCGPFVMTMERDAKAFGVAATQLKVLAKHGFGEEAAEALCALRSRNDDVQTLSLGDSLSLDFDGGVACELLQVSDALAIVEEMAGGRGEIQTAPFDMIFVDADKTRLLDYVEACLTSDRVLKKGGLIVVDNVLWKGLVVEAQNGEFHSLTEEGEDDDNEALRKNRRARKLANKMHRFNSAVVKDNRVEVLLLPMRDGLSVIRKK